MEIKKLNAARGWIWVKQGYQLIMHNPLLSIILALISVLCIFITIKIPQVGPFIAVLLIPILMAGYMRACRALELEEEIELTHLFEGFQKKVARLLSLGGFAILGLLFASLATVLIGGTDITQILENFQSTNDPQMLADALSGAGLGVLFSLIVGFTLVLMMVLALQYAPMLVFFSGLTAAAALRNSLVGSIRNLIPYTVYNIIMQLLALVLGPLPYGIGLIVLIPLSLTSLYVSYRNIFPFAGESTAAEAASPNSTA